MSRRLLIGLPFVALWALLIAFLYDLSVADYTILPWVMGADVVIAGATLLMLLIRIR